MKAIHPTWQSAVALILLAVSPPTRLTAAPISGPIFNPATGHNYYLLENSNWTNAQSQALALGGNLATINDAAENIWVVQGFSNYGDVVRDLWVGLSSAPASGGNPSNYFWIDGDSSAYRNWAPGEPNFADQYVYILPPGVPNSAQWNNTANQTSTGYLDNPPVLNYGVAEVVPEPATYLLVLLGSLLLCRCGSRRCGT
jgi:Lectin C-type domain/PEP-CTERM motif